MNDPIYEQIKAEVKAEIAKVTEEVVRLRYENANLRWLLTKVNLPDLDVLKADLEELGKDKARLDWLDENMSYMGGGNGGTYSFRTPADVECGLLRQAIDAAMFAPLSNSNSTSQ